MTDRDQGDSGPNAKTVRGACHPKERSARPVKGVAAPLVDIHCHLLAGLDDGPKTMDEALEMCEIAWREGTQMIAATAHINDHWPDVTPSCIRLAARKLAEALNKVRLPVTTFPSAEIMVCPDLIQRFVAGQLLTVGDRGRYLLIELPSGVFLDLRDLVVQLVRRGVTPILAHPERHPELLHDDANLDALVSQGCLVQVSSSSLTTKNASDLQSLRGWITRGLVHLIASDGHSPLRRPPLMAEAYRTITSWAGAATADRICSTNGLAIVQGLPIKTLPPKPAKRRWLSFRWK